MNPRFRKVTLIAASLGLLLSLFLALRPQDDEAATTTTTARTTLAATTGAATTIQPATTAPPAGPTEIIITVVDGRPYGGVQRPSLTRGEEAVLVVASDVADEIHLHGYDISADVEAGGSVRLPFTADVPGRFELELEDRGVLLADLEVRP